MIKKRLIGLFPGSKKYIALQVLWQWLSLLCRVIFFMDIALLLGGMISLDEGIKLNGEGIRLLYLIPIPVSILLRFLLDQMANDASFKASRDVKMILREEIYEKLLRLGPTYKESVNTAEVTTLVTEGVEQTESYFSQYLPQLFYAAVSEITLFIILLFVNVKAAVIILIFIPLIPLSIVAVQKIAKRMLSGYFAEYLNLSDGFLESLNILTTLKIFGSDPHRSAALSEESENFRKTTMKVLLMQLNSTSIMDILAYGGAAAGMITGVYSYFNGDVTFTGALLIILLAVEFFLPMRRLGSFFHVAMNGMASSDRIFELLDIPEESSGEDIFPHGPAKIRVTDLKYTYHRDGSCDTATNNVSKLETVSQEPSPRYAEASTELHGRGAIRGMSLVINPGEVTAIVGKSGCGKSTFAKVLSGSLKGYEGSIKINGIEINTIDDHDRMLRIAYIDSDPYIFRGSVRENLQMARHETTDDDMVKVLRRVSLWEDLIDQNGLDTYLTEEGKNISAGQRQRLAMARVLLSHAKVFIFDEATSATDHETEEILLDLIYELAKEGKTVILISHRLSNVEKADVIYYMDEGQITESGVHDRLVFDDGAYSALYEIQSELEKYGRGAVTEKESLPLEGVNEAVGASALSRPERSGEVVPEGDRMRCSREAASSDEVEKPETDAPRRNPVAVMLSLVMLVKPLVPIMVIAIILGTIGAFAAAFVTIQGGRLLVSGSFDKTGAIILVAAAVLRGILHYGEQYANHDIAFKLLSTIRGRVFGKLRTLAPAKL
ncbi:MAG: ATP-binding cassette domain-containing protein, partial [Lachnospiraceae bacterium]|nr:ATP-binding cassette domain-containing protein [Lachnospiraceae bacterium]